MSCSCRGTAGASVVALATFQGDVSGTVTLTQGAQGGAVSVKVALRGLDPAQGPFPWHVHTLPVTVAGGCDGTGGHYATPLKEEGELSQRHGDLPATATVDTTYTDTSGLALLGGGSVLGRSIVLHRGGKRMACATLAGAQGVRFATASFGAAGATGPQGTITFTQGAEGGPTVIEAALTQLQYGPNGWHVHENPVPSSGDCSAGATGGHYNPTVNAGELSAKHQALPNASGAVAAAYEDNDVELFGTSSVLGRSVVLHKNQPPERWACASIVQTSIVQTGERYGYDNVIV